MHRQVGDLVVNTDGLAERGLLVRWDSIAPVIKPASMRRWTAK
jgi:hypothetical protein